MDLKQRVQQLWQFASNHDKVNEHAHTPEYKAGVADAIARLEFLVVCHKYGPGDQATWDAMENVNEGIELVKLLLDVPEAPKVVTPTITTGHCKHKNRLGGCTQHNLHCGWPKCDQRVE